MNEVDDEGDAPIILAAWKGSLESAKVLLEAGADPNVESRNRRHTALSRAVRSLKTMELLINEGADVNGGERKKPLHHAVELSQLKCVRFLINAGADVNSVTAEQISCLHYAAKGQQESHSGGTFESRSSCECG